jgi:hypothetical protein
MSVGCQRSFVESHVEPDFFARKCTCTNIKKHHHCTFSALISFASLSVCVRGFARSPFVFGDIAPLQNMASEVPALPLECVPALPEFPQQAPQENSIRQETALAMAVWIVEATDDLDESGHRHKHVFYVLLNEWFQGRDYTCTLLTKQKYNEILQFCLDLIDGADPWSLFIAGNKQAYKWVAKYDAIDIVGESTVLVLRPTKGPLVDAQSICLSALQQPTYVERLFSDLHKIHRVDHCKGPTLSK